MCGGGEYPEFVRRALPAGRLEALEATWKAIDCLGREEESFFRLALLAIIPEVSLAVANGGWLRWSKESAQAEEIPSLFAKRVEMMLSEVGDSDQMKEGYWGASIADARAMPAMAGAFSAVISSPPYPNRHDYSRIFAVELMFGFQGLEANRALRRQSFHSHPEARPKRPASENYQTPRGLGDVVEAIPEKRVQRMVSGYFLDLFLCLREMARVCRRGARVALVLGNAQYEGKPILVDEYAAELGERGGLSCKEIRALRWRGNSAQQMGKFGRKASRESVVIFQKG